MPRTRKGAPLVRGVEEGHLDAAVGVERREAQAAVSQVGIEDRRAGQRERPTLEQRLYHVFEVTFAIAESHAGANSHEADVAVVADQGVGVAGRMDKTYRSEGSAAETLGAEVFAGLGYDEVNAALGINAVQGLEAVVDAEGEDRGRGQRDA